MGRRVHHHDSSPGKTKLESGLTFLTFLQRSQLWADLGSGISRFSGPGRMARGELRGHTTAPHRTFSEARLVCVSYDVLLQLLIHPCSLPIKHSFLPIYIHVMRHTNPGRSTFVPNCSRIWGLQLDSHELLCP